MLSIIEDWFFSDLGEPGEFQYKAIHLITVAVILAITITFGILCASKKISEKTKRNMLIGTCAFHLIFEVTWRILYITIRHDSWLSTYPMYPCNLSGILIPIIALCDFKPGKKLFYLFGFATGVLTFVMPEGIFTRSVLTFPILKSILQHTGLILIPVMEYASGKYKENIKNFNWLFVGLVIHVINAEVIDPLLGFNGDFMFFRSNLPFVIPGVPQWFTMSFFGILVLVFLELVSDVNVTKEVFIDLKNKLFYKKKSKNIPVNQE